MKKAAAADGVGLVWVEMLWAAALTGTSWGVALLVVTWLGPDVRPWQRKKHDLFTAGENTVNNGHFNTDTITSDLWHHQGLHIITRGHVSAAGKHGRLWRSINPISSRNRKLWTRRSLTNWLLFCLLAAKLLLTRTWLLGHNLTPAVAEENQSDLLGCGWDWTDVYHITSIFL